MTNPIPTELLQPLASEDYCYVTTTGRVTGNPHQIEIWFGLNERSLYLLSGNGQSDWIKNMKKTPAVIVRVGKHTFRAVTRIVTDPAEDQMARLMLARKYQEVEEGDTLSEWARTATPVAIDLVELINAPA